MPPEQNEEVIAPAVDEQISQVADQTGDTSAEVVIAPIVEGTPSVPSLAETLDAAIAEGSGPKRITPKADDVEGNESRPRNADGTFKTETAEEKTAREAAETPEAKAAREIEEAKAAKKEPDAVNDPIPDGLNKRTTERIKSLVDTVKAMQGLESQHNQLFEAIRGTGASPDEFHGMLKYMSACRSDDPVVLEQALTVLRSEQRAIMLKIGTPIPEVNLLKEEANADLVERIRQGTLDVQSAHELAVSREQKLRRSAASTAQSTAVTVAATAKAEGENGLKELQSLYPDLIKADTKAVFEAKHAILSKMLGPLFERLEPSAWKATYAEHYANMPAPQVAAPVVPVAQVERQMPLRPKSPAGGGSPGGAPKSALDAMSEALAGM